MSVTAEYISLISFGYFDKGLLEMVSDHIVREFHLPVRTREGFLDLSEYYDPSRRQYNGSLLLKKINTDFATDNSKAVGLFNVDLFIPILTYIFGQAFLNGRAGIISVYRFSNERYGMKPDSQLLADRFRKEIMHELGHMFGLVHCTDPVCIMRSGSYVEDIDQKYFTFCDNCRGKILDLNI